MGRKSHDLFAEIGWFTCLMGAVSLQYAQCHSLKPRMPYGRPEWLAESKIPHSLWLVKQQRSHCCIEMLLLSSVIRMQRAREGNSRACLPRSSGSPCSCWLSTVEPVGMSTLTVCAPLPSCLSTPAFIVLNFLPLECFCILFEAQILKKNFF